MGFSGVARQCGSNRKIAGGQPKGNSIQQKICVYIRICACSHCHNSSPSHVISLVYRLQMSHCKCRSGQTASRSDDPQHPYIPHHRFPSKHACVVTSPSEPIALAMPVPLFQISAGWHAALHMLIIPICTPYKNESTLKIIDMQALGLPVQTPYYVRTYIYNISIMYI